MDLASQARQLLEGYDFPAPKKDVLQRAQQLRADENLLRALEGMPEGVYASAGEVAEHVGGKHAGDRGRSD